MTLLHGDQLKLLMGIRFSDSIDWYSLRASEQKNIYVDLLDIDGDGDTDRVLSDPNKSGVIYGKKIRHEFGKVMILFPVSLGNLVISQYSELLILKILWN